MSENPPHLGDDFEVLARLVEWLQAGEAAALVTVLRTWGSSPRPPGSLLAIRKRDGRVAGSVSGGCVEDDLVARYVHEEIGSVPTRIDYGVDPAGAARHGLPCGGQLELLVESPRLESVRPALDAIANGELLARTVCLDSGAVRLDPADRQPGFSYAPPWTTKVFGPQWRLLLVGAGQLADHVARIALTLGFHVTVCDPREGQHTTLEGVGLTRAMPDDAVSAVTHPRRTAVVTLAHDPKLDDLALLDALPRDFFYVGALGSKRSSAARRERLAGLGIDPRDLARLHAPVGLDIGSHTPAEIAVSIVAELVAARHGVSPVPVAERKKTGGARTCV
jgi:xanthine dehydrogenase accessory factor